MLGQQSVIRIDIVQHVPNHHLKTMIPFKYSLNEKMILTAKVPTKVYIETDTS